MSLSLFREPFHLLCSGVQVLYTIGGLENLKMAKKYYASTVNLTGGKNRRALFGVCLVGFLLPWRSLGLSFHLDKGVQESNYTLLYYHCSSAPLRSLSSLRGGTKRIEMELICSPVRQQLWRKTTSRELPINFSF